jgi:hypothetical protein
VENRYQVPTKDQTANLDEIQVNLDKEGVSKTYAFETSFYYILFGHFVFSTNTNLVICLLSVPGTKAIFSVGYIEEINEAKYEFEALSRHKSTAKFTVSCASLRERLPITSGVALPHAFLI